MTNSIDFTLNYHNFLDSLVATDWADIMRYGVMSIPALVVDEKVVSTGKVPAYSQVVPGCASLNRNTTAAFYS